LRRAADDSTMARWRTELLKEFNRGNDASRVALAEEETPQRFRVFCSLPLIHGTIRSEMVLLRKDDSDINCTCICCGRKPGLSVKLDVPQCAHLQNPPTSPPHIAKIYGSNQFKLLGFESRDQLGVYEV